MAGFGGEGRKREIYQIRGLFSEVKIINCQTAVLPEALTHTGLEIPWGSIVGKTVGAKWRNGLGQ